MLNRRFFIAIAAVGVVFMMALLSLQEKKEDAQKFTGSIYECFELSSSLDTLKSHLKEHDSFVDRFVILESSFDEFGQKKELQYESFKSDLTLYLDKIIYISCHSCPQDTSKEIQNYYLKNQYLKALDECSDKDVIIFSQVSDHLSKAKIYQAVVGLEKHPMDIYKFQDQGSSYQVTSYSCVKKDLPATIEKKGEFRSHIPNWKSFFFPIQEGHQ